MQRPPPYAGVFILWIGLWLAVIVGVVGLRMIGVEDPYRMIVCVAMGAILNTLLWAARDA